MTARLPRAQRYAPAPIVELLDGATGIRVTCPHCGRSHLHSPSVGHRAAHCELGRAMDGYIVTDPDGLLAAVKP
ncbi:MAG: hypothetical protein ACTHU1_13270 [Arachnia sp.]